MKNMILVFTLLISGCGSSVELPEYYTLLSAEEQNELKVRMEQLSNSRLNYYVLPYSFTDRDTAVIVFIEKLISDGNFDESVIYSEAEFREYFWPNNEERFTLDPGMDPDMAIEWHMMRRRIGLEKLSAGLGQENIDLNAVEIHWGLARRSHALTIHPIEIVKIHDQTFKQLKFVIEHRGQFKLGNLGP